MCLCGREADLTWCTNCFQKLFGFEMAEFKVTVKCMWNSETGDFELLEEGEEAAQGEDDDDDDDDEEC